MKAAQEYVVSRFPSAKVVNVGVGFVVKMVGVPGLVCTAISEDHAWQAAADQLSDPVQDRCRQIAADSEDLGRHNMRILTIVKDGVPVEDSQRFADDAAVVKFLHSKYGGSVVQKLSGHVWLNAQGVSRMTFEGTENSKALPGAVGLTFFLDSDNTFAAMNSSATSPQTVVPWAESRERVFARNGIESDNRGNK